jgi:energy-coupling factor transporter ATP-binding protein EcfA2
VVIEALQTVDAWDWVQRLPEQLGTMLGSGHQRLTPAQAQQIALARLVVADPHTLVLDEATSLIDPRTARHLEGSMAALLQGRTVVAIAHRLHTAHDADRIAVVIDGRIAELGSHPRAGGAAWRVRPPVAGLDLVTVVLGCMPLNVAFLRTRPRIARDSVVHGCVSPHKVTNAARREPGRNALIHSHQKSTIHRFLMVRTIRRVVMKLPCMKRPRAR